MKLKLIWKNARAAAVEWEDGSVFEMDRAWSLYVNGVFYRESNRVVEMVYGLLPGEEYWIRAVRGEEEDCVNLVTDGESLTLDVRRFGAAGDGVRDDTGCVQAAIMACPREGRVLVPRGIYRVTSLFLKDDLNLELEEGAVLSAFTERERFPVLPGVVQSLDGLEERVYGTWEGDCCDMFSGILTGVGVKRVTIYGPGRIDGNASWDNWWMEAKKIRIAARPRMLFLNRCEEVAVVGITVANSPSWNIHPYFSKKLSFIGVSVLGPKDSPNTDGLNPESCDDVRILGCYFSVGDDCIAVKSGKMSMEGRYRIPCTNLLIRQCCMRDGHGSIVLGSEMAGGIRGLYARDCLFLHTDRGLRIKTRRGRGKDAVVDDVVFEHIRMDEVKTPFVVNCFYNCDPDGHSEYVQCKSALPVDERTPWIKELCFRDIRAENCHMAAAFFYGLPEQMIQKIQMEHVVVTYSKEAEAGRPAMMDGMEESMSRVGIYACNVEELALRDIWIEGQNGAELVASQVGVKYL